MAVFQLAWERGIDNPLADLRTGRGQGGDVFDIQRRQPIFDAGIQTAVREEFAIGIGRGGETARYADALSPRAD